MIKNMGLMFQEEWAKAEKRLARIELIKELKQRADTAPEPLKTKLKTVMNDLINNFDELK